MKPNYLKLIASAFIAVVFILLAYGSDDSKSTTSSDSNSGTSTSTPAKKTRTVYSGGYAVEIDLTIPSGYEEGPTCTTCDGSGVTSWLGHDMICPGCNGRGFELIKKRGDNNEINNNTEQTVNDRSNVTTVVTTHEQGIQDSINAKHYQDSLIAVANNKTNSSQNPVVPSNNSNESQTDVFNLVFKYYQDFQQNSVNANDYFASNVIQFINMKNITSGDVNNAIASSKNEFSSPRFIVNRFSKNGNFMLSRTENGISYYTFDLKYTCFRNSKQQFEECDIIVEIGLNSSNKFVSYRELKLYNLKFHS
jgi:hypothetical protein